MELKGAVGLVTGGGTGIGKAIALALADAGCAAVVVNYARSRADAEATARELGAAGAEGLAWQADVSKEPDVLAMVEAVAGRFGRLDVLVNNAGTTSYVDFKDLAGATDDLWREIMATNLMGAWYCSRAAAPHLKRQGGAIVNVASMAGHVPGGSSLPYGVSKAALIQLTRALAVALAPEVRVNSISPGQVTTRWARVRRGEEFAEALEKRYAAVSPLGRPLSAEDCARAALGLILADGVTGQDLKVDSGRSLTH